jgi:hypothetical protein
VGSQLHGAAPFTHGERTPGTNWIGVFVHHRSGLDDMEKSKFLTLILNSNYDLLVVESVVSHYTDYAVPAHTLTVTVK